MKTIEPGGRTALEVYEELKRRLEGMGYLPDAFSGWNLNGGMDGSSPEGRRCPAPPTTAPATGCLWM